MLLLLLANSNPERNVIRLSATSTAPFTNTRNSSTTSPIRQAISIKSPSHLFTFFFHTLNCQYTPSGFYIYWIYYITL